MGGSFGSDRLLITACRLQGVRSSSRLVSVQHVNNFTTATATHRQQSLALSQVRELLPCCGNLHAGVAGAQLVPYMLSELSSLVCRRGMPSRAY